MMKNLKLSSKIKEISKDFTFLFKIMVIISLSVTIFLSCYDVIYQTGFFSNYANKLDFNPLYIKNTISDFIQHNETKKQINENLNSAIISICLLCLTLQSLVISKEEKTMKFFTKTHDLYRDKFNKNELQLSEQDKNLLYRWFIFTSNSLKAKIEVKQDYLINLKESFILVGLMLFSMLFDYIKPIHFDLFYIQTVEEKQALLISLFFDVIVLNVVLLLISLIFLIKFIMDFKSLINYPKKSIFYFKKERERMRRYAKNNFNLKDEQIISSNNNETLVKDLEKAICEYFNVKKINDLIIL